MSAAVQQLPAGPLGLRIEHGQSASGEYAKIAGTVLDATGASVPGATVTLRPTAGASTTQVKTDARGSFNLAGLPAGRYDLQIAAPGFATVTRSLDLEARDLALLTSQLSAGAASETVTVAAAADTLDTGSSTLASIVQPMTETVAQSKRVLGLDPDGAISLSTDRGRHWKRVKPQWTGKVVRLAAAASGDGFEITTDANAVWLSRDGKHWRRR